MLSFKFDSIGSKKVKWPATDVAVIETARKLISAESSLPDSLCFPRLNLLRHTLANAENAVGVLAIDDSGDLLDEDAAWIFSSGFTTIARQKMKGNPHVMTGEFIEVTVIQRLVRNKLRCPPHDGQIPHNGR